MERGLIAEGECQRIGSLAKLQVPERLSILEEPEAALSVVRKLNLLHTDLSLDGLEIDHSQCKQLDLDASVLMDITLMSLKNTWRTRRQRVELRARTPQTLRSRKCFVPRASSATFGLSTRSPRLSAHRELRALHWSVNQAESSRIKRRRRAPRNSFRYTIRRCLNRNGLEPVDEWSPSSSWTIGRGSRQCHTSFGTPCLVRCRLHEANFKGTWTGSGVASITHGFVDAVLHSTTNRTRTPNSSVSSKRLSASTSISRCC